MQKKPKRPTDVIGNAVHVMRLATGEAHEPVPEADGKDPAAKSLGKRGGTSRAKSLTPERRSEIARQAALQRWKK
jgi:hypothetical protein